MPRLISATSFLPLEDKAQLTQFFFRRADTALLRASRCSSAQDTRALEILLFTETSMVTAKPIPASGELLRVFGSCHCQHRTTRVISSTNGVNSEIFP